VILAGLDIGTNTLRLLVARITPAERLEELHSEQKIIRLGEGLEINGHLLPRPMGRTIDALKAFHAVLKRYPADGVVAVATSAVREAVNGLEFVKVIQKETGIQVEVITPEEEARRTLLGVLSGFPQVPQSFLIMDIGGGSTELMWGDTQGLRGIMSTDLGVVKLTERYLPSPTVAADAMNTLMEFIQGRIEEVRKTLLTSIPGGFRPVEFIGTAGTITTLAAIELGLRVYDPQRIHLHRMSLETVKRIIGELSIRTPLERLSIPGLEKGREDLILPGSLILLLTMQTLNLSEVVVSEYGLREGILVDYYRRLKANMHKPGLKN
jgi:exopolyphosphatase/guanosine-5'-triphosphate,3'-diphosphate pyrophosphatase